MTINIKDRYPGIMGIGRSLSSMAAAVVPLTQMASGDVQFLIAITILGRLEWGGGGSKQ